MTDTPSLDDIPQPNESTCPICGRRWTLTPLDDCLLPACGHYGSDVTVANPNRPCHNCGLAHAWKCIVEARKR